jgi:D-tyrosyl-tRNA(Tyr) deacylase
VRIVAQRVSRAEVRVDGKAVASIGAGLMLLVAVEREDAAEDLEWCADKVIGMRIFADGEKKMNRSLLQAGGEILAVSQFTLAGSLRRGRRPSFDGAAPPEEAARMYEEFVGRLRAAGAAVSIGIFGAMMDVELVNDGPVTMLLDSAERHRPRSEGAAF